MNWKQKKINSTKQDVRKANTGAGDISLKTGQFKQEKTIQDLRNKEKGKIHGSSYSEKEES